MSIYHLQQAKELKELGSRLGREKIAERVLFCVDMMLKDQHYQGVIEFTGRMKAIVQACNYDGYWSEKTATGFNKELGDLDRLARDGINRYFGYSGNMTKKGTEECPPQP